VEKGSVAEIIRNGNTTGNAPPTWATYRTLYTLSGSALATLTTGNTGLDATTLDWVRGRDVDNENNLSPVPAAAAQPTRFSLHGDVVHSRSYVVDQTNLSRGSTLYYGANDGALRAVDASNGKERWAFYSPESFTKMSRLRTDSPLIAYAGLPLSGVPTPTAKDYFFDGPIGAYQSADNSSVWIYAAQRRGGRMIYGLDVSTPDAPSFKWRVGCPNLGNDTGCTSGMSGIGQTWSTPKVGFIKGYSTTAPVIFVGGGYHTCEDADTSSPSCASTKGNIVYVLDASSGAVIATFATERSVVADVALIDVNYDGYVDYAYVADTGGNLYRLDFIASPTTYVPLASNAWTVHYVGYTNGAGRKFHYTPSLLHAGTKVYVALGSGDRERPLITNYPYTTPVVNRFYVYVDDLAVAPAAKANATNLDSTTTMSNFSATTSCADAGVLPNSTAKGWFMNLAHGTGEQTVTSAVIVGGMVAFSTNRAVPTSALACSANLGEARGYWLNLLNASGAIGSTFACGGSRSATFVGGGLPPSPVKSTVLINGKEVTVVLGASQLNGSPSGAIQAQRIPIPVNKKRHPIYWYQNTDN
jgi:Tfp pilus tip-associated adhesin PilY1